MGEAKKGRLEVQEILRQNILSGLSRFGHDGIGVMEFANASMQSVDGVVLMNRVRTKRVGWQACLDETVGNKLIGREEWIEEQHWQLSCIKKRGQSGESASTIVSDDIADDLVAWFNGDGCMFFRRHGMANLRIDTNSILVYNDNSDLYQRRAVFTVKIQVPKEITSERDAVDAIMPDVEPV